MDDLLREFVTETMESLERVDAELVKFERDPNNAEILGSIFRLVHTIKGTCGFLSLSRLGALAHAAETLMGHFRDGVKVRPEAVDLIMRSIDRIKDILVRLEKEGGTEPDGDDSDLIVALEMMAEEATKPALHSQNEQPEKEDQHKTSVEAPHNEEDSSSAELDELERLFRETPVDPRPPAVDAKPNTPSKEAASSKDEGGAHGREASQSIRVNVETIEQLMTMVSELVLTRNQLLDLVRRQEDSEFKVPLQRLSQVTTELQDAVMKTRMQPIGNAWQKLPRIVRDLSRDLDKPIDLQMHGADTELDRQVLEMIKDPLTHMIRNSADHGLEMPQDRRSAGKSDTGTIKLSAYHEGGYIVIEVSDDGKGLDTARIRDKAISKGLVSAVDAEKMSDAQIHAFIFHPGFSTADIVTSVSGRGVGMDVVRTNIELIGGSINVVSSKGQGSTFLIKIPLTLAIVSALIIETASECFAIPQLSVIELVRIQQSGEYRIERIKDTPVLRLRGALLPVIHLDRLLGIGNGNMEDGYIVVMQVGHRSFGLAVDNVLHTEEIVIKPVSSILRHVSMFSGTTILGDGRVILIIDPNSAAQAMEAEAIAGIEPHLESMPAASEGLPDRTMALVVFKAGTDEPKAVPLSLVTRLEVFDASLIERLTGQDLVQYRDALMPLVYLNEETRHSQRDQRSMLVFTDQGKSIGLVVDEIIDIVDENFSVEFASEVPGIVGMAVIRGKATEILDIGYFLPASLRATAGPKGHQSVPRQRVLFVDDNAFFRNMLTPVLEAAGYDLTVCGSVAEAYTYLEGGKSFKVIISDIDMPEVDGFTFVERLRADERTCHLPVIALSGLNTPEAIERGRQAGFTDYIAKFDKQGLLNVLKELTAEEIEVSS